jgi:hypothetical protein
MMSFIFDEMNEPYRLRLLLLFFELFELIVRFIDNQLLLQEFRLDYHSFPFTFLILN